MREKFLRRWCRTYGYTLKGNGVVGYMLYDNRTNLNVLGAAAGKDGLGATDRLEAWSSSLDDVEELLGEIRAQSLRNGAR